MAQDEEKPEKTRVVRLEVTLAVPETLKPSRYESEDSAILSRVLEVATHRPVDNRITFLDAFETVGLTVKDVSCHKVGGETPTSEDIFELGARWYGAEVRSLARSILGELKELHVRGEIADENAAAEWITERVFEACDGHNWIIYTAKARLVNAMTDSPDAYEDDGDGENPTAEQRAFASLRADVSEALPRYADEYGLDEDFMPIESDDDADDDETDGEP